ncbi:phage major capsid protein [Candidatus Saccharibacteria bacterium]|nr:phage major capsid protein [Candidatus Saccharibacteria bacterium]
MADVGLGQVVTTTGRARGKVARDAVKDSHPVYAAMEKHGGIRREDGGRTVVEEALSGQNSSVAWVGANGSVSLADQNVVDAAESSWFYMLASVVWTLAERYQNSGASDTKIIDVVGSKFDAAEASMMNIFHAAMLSNGTGSGGLQMPGLAALVSTTPTSGTVMTIDRSSSNAAWFRNQKFDTGADWSDGSADAGNIKRLLTRSLNLTAQDLNEAGVQLGLLGSTHYEYLDTAINAIQQITNTDGSGKAGFRKLFYQGIPMYFSGGLTYSSQSQQTATRSYLLNVKRGGVNLVFHDKAEFDMLEPVNSQDQAAVSRLFFTMACMTIGGHAKKNVVVFD